MKIRSKYFSSNPIPLSLTVIRHTGSGFRTTSPATRTTGPSPGLWNFSALPIRFCNNCRTCVASASIVGNSFGGAIALRLAARRPERVDRLVLMGSVGVPFRLTEGEGLDAVWGYEPSLENMRALLDVFAYSRELVSDELAEVRYRASVQPGFQEAFATMFPAPRQRWVDAMVTPDEEIRRLPHETLMSSIELYGTKVIPLVRQMLA